MNGVYNAGVSFGFHFHPRDTKARGNEEARSAKMNVTSPPWWRQTSSFKLALTMPIKPCFKAPLEPGP
jgi:hypothetical protein